ncbi:hypothetical protein [Methyloprofundus sp.]|uniref:hypothetical protein n=1 Tax=Methyloprofundus sp. TaxID=2020875 RepID=UPI003D0C72B6
MNKLSDLEKTIKRQQNQIELLRNKFFSLQEAIIFQNGNDITQIPDSLSPVEIEDRGGRVTILAFSGMLTTLAMPKAEFFKSLSGNKNVNIIFVKDFKQAWYQCGLLGLTENITETTHFLKKIIPDSTERLVTIGTSAGGFAAILFGCLLGAQKSVSFAPQTFLNKKEFMVFRSIDSRWTEIQESKFLDLKRVIGEANTTHNIYVGKYNHKDMAHAANLTNFEKVFLHEIDSESHNIAKFLKDAGQLDSIIKEVLNFDSSL